MKAQSSVIYRGPSLIDGAPIVAIAIIQSGNRKTGDMVQTYILRADMDAREASRTGADFSICGNCPHRGTPTDSGRIAANRSCYVNLAQGVTVVYKKFAAGGYPDVADVASIGRGRMVRLGTYGDPAAVPSSVWRALISEAIGHTAYSHQSKTDGADFQADLFMVSADSEAHAREAWAQGRRTFRVIPLAQWKTQGAGALVKGSEILCPASAEAGFKAQCADCGLCAGASKKARSVAIVAHGAGARAFA